MSNRSMDEQTRGGCLSPEMKEQDEDEEVSFSNSKRKSFPFLSLRKNKPQLPTKSTINKEASNIEKNLILGPIVGKGSFATVRTAKFNKVPSSVEKLFKKFSNGNHGKNITTVALKCVDKQFLASQSSGDSLQAELRILSRCAESRYIARMYFSYETETHFYIGLEYCPGGDMYTRLLTSGIVIDESLRYIREIAEGLFYLHKQNILYQDLKPENICVDPEGHVKIIDFGLAMIFDESHYDSEKNRYEIVTSSGTLDYSAPEVFLRQPHGFESDWWSFGVISYELLCGSLPFDVDADTTARCKYICSQPFHENEYVAAGSVEYSFVEMFLVKDRDERMGYDLNDIPTIFDHPLLRV